jgi:hypothetical protein
MNIKITLTICLIAAVIAPFIFSKTSKQTLSPQWGPSDSYLFRSPDASKGVLILDNYYEELSSKIILKNGEISETIPGNFLSFLSDGSFFSYLDEEVYFWGPQGELRWKKKMHVHHDVYLNEASKQIFFVSGEVTKRPNQKKSFRSDAIVGLNFSGETIFEWKFSEHRAQVEKIHGKKIDYFEGENRFVLTHFNSVQELDENPLMKDNPVFAKGNLLVNDIQTGLFFIIDRNSKKIVWSNKPENRFFAHSVRLLADGRIVFLRNENYHEHPAPTNSSIAFFDPIKNEIIKNLEMNPPESFFTKAGGTIQVLSNGRFLVTESYRGRVFEIDESGKIYLEWVYPGTSNTSPFKVYRVQLIPEDVFEKSQYIRGFLKNGNY